MQKIIQFIDKTICIIIPIFLILNLFLIQVWHHKKYLPLINNQLFSKIGLKVPRGEIYDRNYKLLTTTLEYFDIYINSKEFLSCNELEKNLSFVSNLLNIPVEEIKLLCLNNKYFLLKKFVSPSVAIKLKTIRGVDITKNYIRVYPQGNVANYVIGRTRIEKDRLIGISGIELYFDNLLNATTKIEFEVFKNGKLSNRKIRFVNNKNIDYIEHKNGNYSIVLTIDSKLQYKVEKILEKYYSIFNPKNIICIIQDPNTGEILTLAIYPNEENVLINPSVSYVFEPGSIYKVFPLAIFLEEKVVTHEDIFYCENGKFRYANHEINDVHPYKNLSVKDIIVYSSNIGMAKMYLLFQEPLKYCSYLKLFGFDTLTGIELPAEVKGSLITPDSKNWSKIQPLMISIGQGVSVTALQIVNAYSMIANGGYLLQPKIVKYIINDEKKIIYESEKTVIRKPISEKTVTVIKDILEEVVTRGTARDSLVPGIKICAKTGTAQKFDNKLGKYSETKYMMSICGFLPKDEPKYTVGVFVDEPKIGRLASQVAVPIFRDVVLEIISINNEILYAKKD